MAEIDTGGGKKVSTKVDMTPMVDLGFLLITFFMLTTTMSKPKTMELNMPDKNPDEKKETIKVKESNTVTLLLGENNDVYWYQGRLTPKKPTSDLIKNDYTEIRKSLLKLKKEIGKEENKKSKKANKMEWAIIVIIKATDGAKYRNMVDILDEMKIVDIGKYAIVDITKDDEKYLDRALGKAKSDD